MKRGEIGPRHPVARLQPSIAGGMADIMPRRDNIACPTFDFNIFLVQITSLVRFRPNQDCLTGPELLAESNSDWASCKLYFT